MRSRALAAALLGVALAAALASCSQGISNNREDPLILVAGASGRAGHFVIRHLRDQGRSFRSLTRDRERAVEKWGPEFVQMNWVEGDVRDAERMLEVMAGVDRVICVIGANQVSGRA